MCAQAPVRIVAVHGDKAYFRNDEGEEEELSLKLAGCARPGQYVTHHRGFALQVSDKKEGEASLDTWGKLTAIIWSDQRVSQSPFQSAALAG